MAEKTKRVSINKLEKYIKESVMDFIPIELGELEFVIKPRLTLKESMEFVQNTVSSCLADEDSEYLPEIKEFAIRNNAFMFYTNLTLPSDVNKKYEFVYGSDIFDIILENIDIKQFNDMLRAIEGKIHYLVSMRVSDVHRQVNEMYALIENLQSKFEEVFSEVDADKLSGFVNAFSEMNITEEGIVKAVHKQYVEESEASKDPLDSDLKE